MNNFAKNSALNLLFSYSNIAFNVVTGVLLVPFYLKEIPLGVYGSYIVAAGIAALIGLLEFGLSMVLTQRLAESFAVADSRTFRETTYSGLVAATVMVTLSCAATTAVSTQVIQMTRVAPQHSTDLRVAFLLLGAAAGANIFLNLFGSVLQALLKAGALGAVNFVSAIVGMTTALGGFVTQPSLVAIAAGPLARSVCATLILLGISMRLLKDASLLPRPTHLLGTFRLLKDCVPLFLGSTSRSLVENAQNLLLVGAVSPVAIAVLSLTQKGLQVANMILAPLGSSIFSNLTQIKVKTSAARFERLVGIAIRGHFLLAVVLIGTATAFNGPFMTLWVGKDKFGGLALSVLLGISALFVSRFAFFGFLMYSAGNFRKPFTLELGYSATKLLLLLLTVSHWGLYSVPAAEIAAGTWFLFVLSNRQVSKTLLSSVSGARLYCAGWLEFALIVCLGTSANSALGADRNWPTLGLAMTCFFLVVVACVLSFNASFIRSALSFRKERVN